MSTSSILLPKFTENDERKICRRKSLILTTKTFDVKKLHQQLMHSYRASLNTYMLVDKIPDKKEVVNYPPEFLNPWDSPGLILPLIKS